MPAAKSDPLLGVAEHLRGVFVFMLCATSLFFYLSSIFSFSLRGPLRNVLGLTGGRTAGLSCLIWIGGLACQERQEDVFQLSVCLSSSLFCSGGWRQLTGLAEGQSHFPLTRTSKISRLSSVRRVASLSKGRKDGRERGRVVYRGD